MTLVIYMGMNHLSDIVQQLLAAGLSSGALNEQRQVICPIGMLPMAVKQEGLGSPAIVVIGDVVRLSSCKEFMKAWAIAA